MEERKETYTSAPAEGALAEVLGLVDEAADFEVDLRRPDVRRFLVSGSSLSSSSESDTVLVELFRRGGELFVGSASSAEAFLPLGLGVDFLDVGGGDSSSAVGSVIERVCNRQKLTIITILLTFG